MVGPNAKLPGSTSVACWLVALVKVSVLSLTKGTVAGGNVGGGLEKSRLPDPEPQADARSMAVRIATGAATRKV